MAQSQEHLLHDAGWQDVLAWLPKNLDEEAIRTGGFERRRVFRRASDILRLCMAYSVNDLSLRGVAAWAATHGVADVSDVAVLKRLRRALPFLNWLPGVLLSLDGAAFRLFQPPRTTFPFRVRIIDATTVSAPGSKGTDWRVHATCNVERGGFDAIELTDKRGGEHLDRAHLRAGDLIPGDRGYAHGARIATEVEEGAHVLVRIGHSAVPLFDQDGAAVDPLEFAGRRSEGPGEPDLVKELPVYIRGNKKKSLPIRLRLIVIRKTAQEIEESRRRLRRDAKRKGKTPTQRTFDAAEFIFLLASPPVELVSAEVLAKLYRVRWQVELSFKRLKSLFHLDALRAKDPKLAQVYILTKLIAAVLVQHIVRGSRTFSPWGLPVQPRPPESVAA